MAKASLVRPKKAADDLKIVMVPTDTLRASEYNPRVWDDVAAEKLRESIRRFGFVDPLIANSAKGRERVLVGGHFRLQCAKDLGITEVPVVFLHITDIKRERELNLRLNKNSGSFDMDLLKAFDIDMLLDVGFDDTDLTALWGDSLATEDDGFDLEQSVRGLRHGAHRPDLIICDDIEDLSSVKTRESRVKTYQWFTRDLIPVGDRTTNIIVVGNLLHEDSLISHLKEDIESEQRTGKIVEYPLLDKENKPLWPGKFKTEQDVLELKRMVGDDVAWSMEYLLEIVSDLERVVQPAWIQRYPDDYFAISRIHRPMMVLGVDLAISEKETADYTAIVPVIVTGDRNHAQIFVTTPIVNRRMSFAEQLDTIELLYHQLIEKYRFTVVVEDVGYQRALIQQLSARGCTVEGFKVGNVDKRTRLNLISPKIRDGEILFPKTGVDHLVAQIVGFGVEKHDDLMDAFVMAATYGFEKSLKRSRIVAKQDSGRSPTGWRRVSSNTFEPYY